MRFNAVNLYRLSRYLTAWTISQPAQACQPSHPKLVLLQYFILDLPFTNYLFLNSNVDIYNVNVTYSYKRSLVLVRYDKDGEILKCMYVEVKPRQSGNPA